MSNRPFNDYKSPVKKLVKFFQGSRDKWKARSSEKQKRIDFLETKVKDLRNSRDHWKQKAKQLEKLSLNDATTQKLSNVQSENNSSTSSNLLPVDEVVDKYYGLDDIEILPHSNGSISLIPKGLLPWESANGHKYILLIQELAIKMVLQAHTSLRGAMKCFELFAQFFPVQVPTWVTIQNWLLRFGLYELQQKLPHRTDRVWIIDCTINVGPKKCFLIAGVTEAHLLKHGFNLLHDDVQVLTMFVISQLNGEIVCQYLEELSQKIGIPKQIVSDHGNDIKKGIELFCASHRKPIYTYDITHKTALLLKGILEPCHTWQSFLNQCGLTLQRVNQTNLSFLAPPNNRKARYMNLEVLISWAQNVLDYQAKGDFSLINPAHGIDKQVLSQLQTAGYGLIASNLTELLDNIYPDKSALSQELSRTLGPNIPKPIENIIFQYSDLGHRAFLDKFSWVSRFENTIDDYSQLIQVIGLAKSCVKKEGLEHQSHQDFKQLIETSQITSEVALELATQVGDFLKDEGESFADKPVIYKLQTGLSTSDVIESIFGKFKTFIKEFADLGKLVLTIPAFLGDITPQNIKQAFESVRQQDVNDWIDESVGQSDLSKRRKAFAKTE
ncbi:MAG: hypothetical protein VSS75_008430 [Candidatus Parabeggiatoa sp.]|nr:hypothetical protein [Candidatus Parabeggiatoa sp.]